MAPQRLDLELQIFGSDRIFVRILVTSGRCHCDISSGAAKIAFDESVELAGRGEEVWMLASGLPSQPEHEIIDGFHLLRYSPADVASWRPARAFRHQKAVKSLLERYIPQVDAIHGHMQLATLAALDFYGDSVHSCYTIHSPARMELAIEWRHSSLTRRIVAPLGLAMINRIESECLCRSHVITALSEYTVDCIGRIHGEKLAERVQLIPGWVDTSRFIPAANREALKTQLGWPKDIPILFTLRRLEWRMGLDRLLNAGHRLLKEGFKFHLMIGGSGSIRGRLEKQVDALGLRNSVTFLGRMEERELPLAYAACDAFVLPTSELECFGLIALEALSAGRPVLATPVGAIPEIIRKLDPSWLARSAEPEDIASLLRQYLTGALPEHSPEELHDRIHRDYNSGKVLSEFIGATIGKCASFADLSLRT
jgi:glycosyltransferase involved in cell wall biosynthesis